MVILDLREKDIYSRSQPEPESHPPLIDDVYRCITDIFYAVNNNSDLVSVGLTAILFNAYF
ncbi:MAG: hypothetical protein KAI18_03390 [Candidatus Aenigmarchaeota archaeon]|nr:hypothetical protein [Candidatus Aenigmarchaeota archaeon]